MKNINPSQTAAWQALQQHYAQMKDVRIADLFAQDSDRFSRFSATFNDQMLVDYSRTVSRRKPRRSCRRWRKKPICKAPSNRCSPVRKSTAPKIARCCTLPCATAATARSGRRQRRDAGSERGIGQDQTVLRARHRRRVEGYTGKPITDVVNIGIGGSISALTW